MAERLFRLKITLRVTDETQAVDLSLESEDSIRQQVVTELSGLPGTTIRSISCKELQNGKED